ncbi:hypothetical protein ACFLXG_04630 [Chloroflexota bacterium]
MKYLYLRIGIIVSLTLALSAIIIRSIWQIVVIPTAGTMLIFIPLIFTLLGANILVAYLTIKPSLKKLKNMGVAIGITLILTGGLVAGVTHYIHFIPSPEATHFLSKLMGTFIVLASVIAYLFLVWLTWSFRKNRRD